MINAVIFDFDNTLMDFMTMKHAAVEAAASAMIDAGLSISKKELIEQIYKHYQVEGIEDQQIFNKVLTQIYGDVNYKILAAGIIGYRRARDGALTTYPQVRLTLTQLHRMGIKMAVVSDAPRLPVWLRICALGLQHDFDVVVTFDDSGIRKPNPKPFQMALEKLKTKPEETLMIGDWAERDMVGAKGVGLVTVFAKYGDIQQTQNSGADYEVDDISDLIQVIKARNNHPI